LLCDHTGSFVFKVSWLSSNFRIYSYYTF
jgi:hypothetical protein